MQKQWDIFCRVVDNYGDAGVCWRLARQLADEFDLRVRLWIDDLAVLRKFRPEIAVHEAEQNIAGVVVCRWTQPLPQPIHAADVVIEAFACEPPEEYLVAMCAQHSLWINLEYLSAEHWVAGCHGLPSPQSGSGQNTGSLRKFFFFPGFQANTGGVLGERDLPLRRRAFQCGQDARQAFFRRSGIEVPSSALTISLFSYRDAPIESLLRLWSAQATPVFCLVPEGQPLAAVARFFGETLCAGAIRRHGALTVAVLPFLSQDDYDRLLWSCDLNFVRGEDSFVRAQWAATPFVWQIYAQEEGAHWPKLDAFLDLYCADPTPLPAATALRNFWRAWNGDGNLEAAWPAYVAALSELSVVAEKWASRLGAGPNLAAALVQFCANHV